MTSDQQVPNSADHEPAPVTDEAAALHGDKAHGEVYDQPEAVTLDGDTRIAAPAFGEDDEDDGRTR